MKKRSKLTQEEQVIEKNLDKGEYLSVPVNAKQKKELANIAKHTLSKNKAITIRLSERNLMRLKATAAKEGIPYQTLVSALIQKNV